MILTGFIVLSILLWFLFSSFYWNAGEKLWMQEMRNTSEASKGRWPVPLTLRLWRTWSLFSDISSKRYLCECVCVILCLISLWSYLKHKFSSRFLLGMSCCLFRFSGSVCIYWLSIQHAPSSIRILNVREFAASKLKNSIADMKMSLSNMMIARYEWNKFSLCRKLRRTFWKAWLKLHVIWWTEITWRFVVFS